VAFLEGEFILVLEAFLASKIEGFTFSLILVFEFSV
jgi:hypothetical protein